jgi:hypothetical protein
VNGSAKAFLALALLSWVQPAQASDVFRIEAKVVQAPQADCIPQKIAEAQLDSLRQGGQSEEIIAANRESALRQAEIQCNGGDAADIKGTLFLDADRGMALQAALKTSGIQSEFLGSLEREGMLTWQNVSSSGKSGQLCNAVTIGTWIHSRLPIGLLPLVTGQLDAAGLCEMQGEKCFYSEEMAAQSPRVRAWTLDSTKDGGRILKQFAEHKGGLLLIQRGEASLQGDQVAITFQDFVGDKPALFRTTEILLTRLSEEAPAWPQPNRGVLVADTRLEHRNPVEWTYEGALISRSAAAALEEKKRNHVPIQAALAASVGIASILVAVFWKKLWSRRKSPA